MPSRKWFVARVTGLTGLAVMFATDTGWHLQETLGAITLVSAAALAYLLPNGDTKVSDTNAVSTHA